MAHRRKWLGLSYEYILAVMVDSECKMGNENLRVFFSFTEGLQWCRLLI